MALITAVLRRGSNLLLFGVLAVATAGGQTHPTSLVDHRVVVQPFVNLSAQPEDAWVGAGIAEAVATALASDELAVRVWDGGLVPRGRSVGTADTVPDHPGSAWSLTGGYQRVGDRVRITARVTEAWSDTVIESVVIDGQFDELFALQDRLVVELRGLFGERNPAGATPGERGAAASVLDQAASVESMAVRAGSGLAIDGPAAPIAPETITRDADGRVTVRAVRLEAPLQLDGRLDERAYGTVPPFSGFIQQQPDEGAPATERTEVWVFFDDQNVYVAGRNWESVPESRWVANEMQRDSFQLIQNEGFSVVLDTFYDRRNGVVFAVNPIGGFMDQQITDEGQSNWDWNPIWNVRTGRFPGGWTVEMAIPFKSLRFSAGRSQVWGLQIGRRIRWKNEWAYLTPVPISAGPGTFRISVAGTLTGIEVPEDNRTLEIKPYAIGSLASDLNAVPPISNSGDGDFGVDVKYGVTQNLTADLTYNTDFAQVEVDEQQVNLTRFSLFFPEKREFFLEGRGIFDFGEGARFGGGRSGGRPGTNSFFGGGAAPRVFFSRRIGLESGQTVPIRGGGRLTGKAGDFTIGALNIQTGDVLGAVTSATNFTVLRIKRDILRRSRIGGIFTGRSARPMAAAEGDAGANQVFGVDAAFAFYDNVNLTGYYAQSNTPGLAGDDTSYQSAFTYNGDLYAMQVDHLLVEDNFNPEIGFLRRDDFRRTFASAQYSPRPSIDAVRQFTWGASLDYIESDSTGLLETRFVQGRFQTEFESSDRFSIDVQESYELLKVPFHIAPTAGVSIPVGGYGFQDIFTSYALGGQRRLSGTLTLQRGEFFDGTITGLGYQRGRVEVTPQFSFEPSLSVNQIALPGGQFTTTLVSSRVTYTFTPRMFFGGLLQYNSSRDSLSTNLRLRWEYQPWSELFVVYNDIRDTELRGIPLLENRAFVVKFTRLFRF
ncbi:MAG: DUF5916 domain-containing protein [Acidobacteriota bacterium]|nr:DUF5916 domain-containing protein [Acidobacteriota bacterium]